MLWVWYFKYMLSLWHYLLLLFYHFTCFIVGGNPVKPEIANTFTFIYPCGIDIRFSFFRYNRSCKCFKWIVSSLPQTSIFITKKDEAIKETITNLAHDLRTPVTAIQGYTQMLLQSPELSEEDLDAAAIINERLNVLNQLLNQLFEFARIEADEMEFSYTTFDLNAVLRSVAVSFLNLLRNAK